MSITKPEAAFVTITDETTVAELAETLRLLCNGAKAIRRQGQGAMMGETYRRQHARIDTILCEIEARV